ncbi:hypothetical protein VF13_41480, partial [Nostoc linckia z16]
KKLQLTYGNSVTNFCTKDEYGKLSPAGIAGWGPKDLYLLLYDEYDIWKISLDGQDPQRLTSGKEKKIRYRLIPPAMAAYNSNFTGHIDPLFDLKNDLLISGTSEDNTGYFILLSNGRLKTIVFDHNRNRDILQSKIGGALVYIAENYNKPPQLLFYNSKKSIISEVVKSNRHHSDYAWGKQQVIHYRNPSGQMLKGLLYYPSVLLAGEQYPMVVHIYEKQYYEKCYYRYPSNRNMTGFNIANLTSKGYFVLLPDIEYEVGNPGRSATNCVMAAIDEAVINAPIDTTKIGVIGHSFGGYETNYIITQSRRFACAISGSSVGDVQGWYLSIGWNSGRPEFWRAETQQWRMGNSLFDNLESYRINSPLNKVKDINTPLLLWTGEQDRQVHYYQSIAFYLALRRLDKKEIMLIYPDEGHALLKPGNQADLTSRMESWLNFFLKDEPASWIENGLNTH